MREKGSSFDCGCAVLREALSLVCTLEFRLIASSFEDMLACMGLCCMEDVVREKNGSGGGKRLV
jgi:hypothetical protein